MTENELKILWTALYRINADNMASCPCKGCKTAVEEGRKVFQDLYQLIQKHQGTHNQIRERAHLLWQEAGCPEGDGVEFWLQAENELQAGQKPAPYPTPTRRISPEPFHEVARGSHGAEKPAKVQQVTEKRVFSNSSMMAEMQAAAEYRSRNI
jgi:hypothetical protein